MESSLQMPPYYLALTKADFSEKPIVQSGSAIPPSLILKTDALMPAEKRSSGWKPFSMAVHSAVPRLMLMLLRFCEQRPRRHDLPGKAEGTEIASRSNRKAGVQEKQRGQRGEVAIASFTYIKGCLKEK